MAKITILQGLPASGKTTWAKEIVAQSGGSVKRINKDDLRAMVDAGEWSKEREKMILKVRNSLIYQFTQEGFDVIVDDTNFEISHENDIRALFGVTNKISVKFFEVSLKEAIERDSKRPNPVGKKVIRRMYKQYVEPMQAKQVWSDTKDTGIICDIDGTLALHNGRSPYATEKCEGDSLNHPVYEIVTQLPHGLILVTGREEKYREQTEKWLRDKNVSYFILHMRPTGDNREDSVVKREIYENEIRQYYNIAFVLDDRNRVVDMWRSLGLTVLQVAEGDF